MKKRGVLKCIFIAILWLLIAMFLLPIAIMVASGWVLYQLYRHYRTSPAVRQRRNHRDAVRLYERLQALQESAALPDEEHFVAAISDELGKEKQASDVDAKFL